MKRKAIIWKESVYKNDFTCNCGRSAGIDGEPEPDMLVDEDEAILICPDCHDVVAAFREVDVPKSEQKKFMGDYEEFLKRTSS